MKPTLLNKQRDLVSSVLAIPPFLISFCMFLFFCLDWYRCEGRFFEDPNNEGLIINFDREVSQTMNKGEEEDVLSPELERLIAQEEREMKPH